jgi:hypothetical protein
MQAVFAPVQFADRSAPFLDEENQAGFESGQARSQLMLDNANETISGLHRQSKQREQAYLKQRGVARIDDLPKDEQGEARSVGLSKLDKSVAKIYSKRSDYFVRELNRFKPNAFSVYSGPPTEYISNKPNHPLPPEEQRIGAVPAVYVLKGGSLETPGEEVAPGVLSAVFAAAPPASSIEARTISSSIDGRRLALAEWIASPDNALTTRVYVNRVWQQCFAGRGLVGTPNNFGKMGQRPSHQESHAVDRHLGHVPPKRDASGDDAAPRI